jgi:hypothetical protein
MDKHEQINDAIRNRVLHTAPEDNTYYNQDLYDYAVDNLADPDLLYRIKILGFYRNKYKWTRAQAEWFIDHNIAESRSHSDGEREYLYDWGAGLNKVTADMMHEPNLDHIDPRSLSRNNDPSNFRIRCARLNENKGNMVSDLERRATIIDMFRDMAPTAQRSLLEYLNANQGP